MDIRQNTKKMKYENLANKELGNIHRKRMNAEIAKKQQAYLLNNIGNASEALSLFESLRNKKFTTGTVKQDNWLEEILRSFFILKIHTIFDRSKRAVCLEKLLKDGVQYIATSAVRRNIIERFENIKKDHQLMIRQIKNNRHEEVAHIPQKTSLGVTEEVAIKIRKFGAMIGNERYKNQKSVSPEKMRFSVGNFPIEEAKNLTKKLIELIFGIKYPRTLDKNKNLKIPLASENPASIPALIQGL